MIPRRAVLWLVLSMACRGDGRSMAPAVDDGSRQRSQPRTSMGAESSPGEAAPIAARLSGILQRLVAANLFPAEYTGPVPAAGPGVPLTGLPFDVDARLFAAAGDQHFVRLHDAFSGTDHWYTQGAIEAAGVGETIGRRWGSAQWPAPVPAPDNLSGDRHIPAEGEAIPVADHITGATFRLFRTPDGVGYVRVTDSAGRTVWLRAALLDS
jgi:hypothetical protein